MTYGDTILITYQTSVKIPTVVFHDDHFKNCIINTYLLNIVTKIIMVMSIIDAKIRHYEEYQYF